MKQNSLLEMHGLTNLIGKKKVKLIRHQDLSRDIDFHKIIDNKQLLEEYQSFQSEDKFNCEYIITYIAFEKTHSLLYGIYQVVSSKPVKNIKVSDSLIKAGHTSNFTGYEYMLEELNWLDDLKNRLVIDWGKGTRSWAQWLDEEKDKEVIEIRPKGYVKEFPGYLDLVLSFNELETLISNKSANRIWFNKLSSIYAIYLILDTETGNQYIGSASGSDGLWGRWSDYAKNIHGGNKGLKELVEEKGKDYKYNFQYSILHVLSATKGSQVEEYENLYKEKLGSRVFGLNKN